MPRKKSSTGKTPADKPNAGPSRVPRDPSLPGKPTDDAGREPRLTDPAQLLGPSWCNCKSLSERWRREGLRYVSAINDYVARGRRDGWEAVGEEPAESREDIAGDVLEVVRVANRIGKIDRLREWFPPAHAPFIPLLEEKGRGVGPVISIGPGRFACRLGTSYQPSEVAVVDTTRMEQPHIIKDVLCVGRSADRRFFALARRDGVDVHQGWGGPRRHRFPWPKGNEGIPKKYKVKVIEGALPVVDVVPFPDGDRVLLISSAGIYVLETSKATRVHPTTEDLTKHFDWLRKEYPKDPLSVGLSMPHGTVSPDGALIAVGGQDGPHRLLDAELQETASVGNHSEYPHFAVFSADGAQVILNSCHFYNGVTIGVAVRDLPGMRTEPYQRDDPRIREIDDGCRVYAAASRRDEYFLGDAHGYVRVRSAEGSDRGEHHLGSTICGMDLSEDGRTLAVGTYAGMLHLLDLDVPARSPLEIGTAAIRERRRWLFWKGENQTLLW